MAAVTHLNIKLYYIVCPVINIFFSLRHWHERMYFQIVRYSRVIAFMHEVGGVCKIQILWTVT